MRHRQFPNVCRSCQRPMARQQDACWSCGAAWADDVRPGRVLTAVRVAPEVEVALAPTIIPAPAGVIGADSWTAAEERWTNEGGAQPAERVSSCLLPAAPL